MTLRRYDGDIFKTNLSATEPRDYTQWITDKSTKPVEREDVALLQMIDVA